jgi:hypothetical protein
MDREETIWLAVFLAVQAVTFGFIIKGMIIAGVIQI